MNKEIWCGNQMIDENMNILCCAHLAENRVFNCPYTSNEKRMESKYPCSDMEEIKQCK